MAHIVPRVRVGLDIGTSLAENENGEQPEAFWSKLTKLRVAKCFSKNARQGVPKEDSPKMKACIVLFALLINDRAIRDYI